jgi:hypothetical protein
MRQTDRTDKAEPGNQGATPVVQVKQFLCKQWHGLP